MDKEEIKRIIHETYETVFDSRIMNEDQLLIAPSAGNRVVYYLYFFQMIDERLHIPTFQVLEQYPYSVMTANKLTDAFYNLISEEKW